MSEATDEKTGNWTPVQAYVLSVICLLLGVTVGYLARGSGAPAAGATNLGQINPGMNTAGTSQVVAPQAANPEQLRQMAEAQVQPLLARLQTDSKNPKLLYEIGNVYYDSQQYPEAIKYYENSLALDPKATDVRTDLGTAYHLSGQPDKAIQEYEQVLKIDGKHANALLNEGMVKWQDKLDADGAVKSWKRLLDTNPDFPQRDRVQQMIAQAQQHATMAAGAAAASAKKP